MKTYNCKFQRYRYSAEKDNLIVKSPSGRIVIVKLLFCKDMQTYWKFSNKFKAIDKQGEFTTSLDWYDVSLTKEEMKEFLYLSEYK